MTKLLQEQKNFQNEQVELNWKLETETAALTRLLAAPHIDEAKAITQLATLVEKEGAAKKNRLAQLIRIKNLLTAEQVEKLVQLRRKEMENED